jgi:hypothetical protein
MSSAEQLVTHLASNSHIREKTKLEKELKLSWNIMKTQQRIPSLLGSWMSDIK